MFSTCLGLTHPPDWVASASNPDCLKHPRVSQLSAAQLSGEHLTIKVELKFKDFRNICNAHQWLLELIGFDAADEEGVALAQSLHQQVR